MPNRVIGENKGTIVDRYPGACGTGKSNEITVAVEPEGYRAFASVRQSHAVYQFLFQTDLVRWQRMIIQPFPVGLIITVKPTVPSLFVSPEMGCHRDRSVGKRLRQPRLRSRKVLGIIVDISERPARGVRPKLHKDLEPRPNLIPKAL